MCLYFLADSKDKIALAFLMRQAFDSIESLASLEGSVAVLVISLVAGGRKKHSHFENHH